MRRPDLATDAGRGRSGAAARSGGTAAPAILALVALVIAAIALGLTLLRSGTDPGTCRTSAWNALPGTSALPAGWSVSGSGFFADSLATTLVGPTPGDGSEAPTVYVTVSCYGSDGHSALVRSRNAELASGGSDVNFPKIGAESYATRDASAGTLSVFVLRGALMANLSSSGTIDLASLELATRAIDGAMTNAQSAGSGGTVTPAPLVSAPPSPSGSAVASPSAAPSHLAPDLESLLPTKAGGVDLTKESTVAANALQDDAAIKALGVALAKIGKKPADLVVAQAYDSGRNLDLFAYAFRIKGMPAATLTPVVVTNWFAPAGSNPKTAKVTVGGKPMTRLDFTDTGGTDYVYLHGDVVYVIETSNAALAAEAGKALP